MAAFIAQHWLVLVLLFALLSCVLGAALSFDALLKYEYKFCRDQWEADGSLPGAFWTVPDAADMVETDIRAQRISWCWFFSTPDWISGVKPLEKKLRLFRAFSLLASIAGILLVIYTAV